MKPYQLILLLCWLASSCKIGKHTQNSWPTSITSYPDSSLIIANADTIGLSPTRLSHSKHDTGVWITVQKDGLEKSIFLKPRTKLFGYHFRKDTLFDKWPIYRLSRLSELGKTRLPDRVHIDLTEYQPFETERPLKKGDWLSTVSIPYLNSFRTPTTGQDVIDKWGFLGIGLGLQHAFKNDRFWQLELGAATNFFFPIPLPIHYSGNFEIRSTVYTSLSINQEWRRWIAGAGIHYSSLFWRRKIGRIIDSDDMAELKPEASWTGRGIGPMLSLSYRTGPNCNLRLLYQPLMLTHKADEGKGYWHFLSIGFHWHFLFKEG